MTNSWTDAPIIMAIITIFALATWWFTPEEKFLSKQHIKQVLAASAEEEDTKQVVVDQATEVRN